MTVIAGTGANSTAEAIEFTASARNQGQMLAARYSLLQQTNTRGPRGALFSIADAVDLSQVLYNVPGRTACDLLPETVARLAVLPQVVAIKEATGSLERAREIRQLCGEAVAIYSGDDATSCDLMLEGAQGTISVTANVAPETMAQMADAAVKGDAELARSLDATLSGLHQTLFLSRTRFRSSGRCPIWIEFLQGFGYR